MHLLCFGVSWGVVPSAEVFWRAHEEVEGTFHLHAVVRVL